MADIRTYESFSIKWDRGSTWSGYDTAEQAQATIDSAAKNGSIGTLVRKTWTVDVPAKYADIYLPGIDTCNQWHHDGPPIRDADGVCTACCGFLAEEGF